MLAFKADYPAETRQPIAPGTHQNSESFASRADFRTWFQESLLGDTGEAIEDMPGVGYAVERGGYGPNLRCSYLLRFGFEDPGSSSSIKFLYAGGQDFDKLRRRADLQRDVLATLEPSKMLLVASDQIVRPALDSRNEDRKVFIHYHTAIIFQSYRCGQGDDLKFQSGHEIVKNGARRELRSFTISSRL
jgi:hypothetical protein